MESTDVGEGVAPAVAGHRLPGQRIGPYEVECTIGAGAMGVVYAAVEPGTQRRLAVKLMHPRGAYAGGPVGPHRADAWLRNEARVLSRLSHPNVVRVYGVGSDHGRPYMAMELVEGRTLAAWLAEGDHGWEETLHVCIEAARGVAAAHRAGIVHGDLKPDNVMVARDGRVIVMDFGLAQSMSRRARAWTETAIPALPDDDATDQHEPIQSEEDDATLRSQSVTAPQSGAPDDEPSAALTYDPDEEPRMEPRMDPRTEGDDEASEDAPRDTDRLRRQPGTPAYMAPELLAGLGGDARSDQFSLCVTMYKALFGRRPYGGRTPTEIAFRVARSDLRSAPGDRDVPSWVHARVTRGLALQPGERWSSVEALIASLERGLGERRRRRSTVAVACVVAGVVAVLALRWLVAGL